jgi:hypothetical protein
MCTYSMKHTKDFYAHFLAWLSCYYPSTNRSGNIKHFKKDVVALLSNENNKQLQVFAPIINTSNSTFTLGCWMRLHIVSFGSYLWIIKIVASSVKIKLECSKFLLCLFKQPKTQGTKVSRKTELVSIRVIVTLD